MLWLVPPHTDLYLCVAPLENIMKRSLSSMVLILFLSFLPPVWADDLSAGVRKTKERAAQGEASAQYDLCFMYAYGLDISQDYTEALKWCRLAAAQGHTSAQYILGSMYYMGQGVPQDYTEALKWC